MTWKNRIVGEGDEAPDQLLANPKNARRHPQAQQQALADVLDEVGVVQRVIVNKRTGYVVDGHARIALALRQGQPTIPVVYVDLDEREEALILATLDPISAMALYDAEALDGLLRAVDTGSAELQRLLTDLATDAGLYGLGKADGTGDPNEDIWQGMPEFEKSTVSDFDNVIKVHFADDAARLEFADLVGQELKSTTRFIHWPPKAGRGLSQNIHTLQVHDES
jgi:hypothetical protein